MPRLHTTQQIIRAVEADPFRRSNITLESALSLPVPAARGEKAVLAFFWYPVGGPAQQRTVGAPYCRVLADPDDLSGIKFTLAEPQEFGLGVPRGASLGGTRIGGSTPATEMKQVREELYGKADRVLDIYPRAAAFLSAAERADVAAFRALFSRLAVVVLLPAYRGLSPDFFAWLDDAAPGA